jgi:hypothetical protein
MVGPLIYTFRLDAIFQQFCFFSFFRRLLKETAFPDRIDRYMDTAIEEGIGAVGTLATSVESNVTQSQEHAPERADNPKRAELALRRSILRKLLRRLRAQTAL